MITRFAPAINPATQYLLLGLTIFVIGSLMLINRPRPLWVVIPSIYRFIAGTAMTFIGMWVAFGGWG